MKVDFMRRIDYWIGIPICFLLTILRYIENGMGIKRLDKGFKPKKILFIELSEMGSTILAYGAMKKAKELYKSEAYFMIFKENEQSIRLLNVIPPENVITIRSKSFLLLGLDTIKAVFKMRSLKIDTVIDLELFSRFTSILSFLSGAKATVGFYRYHMEGLYRGNFITHKIEYNPHIHISYSFMSMVYSLKYDYRDIPMLKRKIIQDEIICPKLNSSEKAKSDIYARLKKKNSAVDIKSRIIIINPNASQLLPIRKWPLENFQELAKKILEIGKDIFLVITGLESEKMDAVKICEYVNNNRCIDFTGETNLKELIDLYNISEVLVSNDSGPAHFASLSNIKSIVLFGPETPKIYAPLSEDCYPLYANLACSPCVSAFNHRKTPCRNNVCLKTIKVNAAYKLIISILH
ncbi:hypothetical protein GF323_04470 [Candidatus Woesearchaeota archaeon]|nr:hypothetical protein [Candidatus Woesearchaeota archaeon]